MNDRSSSKAVNWSGPWMSAQALERLPHMRVHFAASQQPNKEAPRGPEAEIGKRPGSSMVRQDGLRPTLRPHTEETRAVDKAHFNARWLAEQREAAMRFAEFAKSDAEPIVQPGRNIRTPSI
jgi:hypothetical protein